MFIRIIFFIFILIQNSYASKNKLTASVVIDSDHNSKRNEYLLKIKQQDKQNKYSQELELNIDKNYSLVEEKFEKTKDLIDYEHEFKHYLKETFFNSLFFRHKYDNFSTSKEQNFTLITIGLGVKKELNTRKIAAQLSIGQRRSTDLYYIYMPKISYEEKFSKLIFNTSLTLAKDHQSQIINSKVTLEYPLNKVVNIKYILKYENSKNYLTKEISRRNKIALAIKF